MDLSELVSGRQTGLVFTTSQRTSTSGARIGSMRTIILSHPSSILEVPRVGLDELPEVVRGGIKSRLLALPREAAYLLNSNTVITDFVALVTHRNLHSRE